MSTFTPPDPDWEARLRRSFAAQPFMGLLGATLEDVSPGRVSIRLPLRPALGQHHGHAHAGAAWSIADSAAGFAAQSMMTPEEEVLTVELKINLIRPAQGASLLATGQVIRAGRQLVVGNAEVEAEDATGTRRLIATTLGTFIRLREKAAD
ncbi:MAG: PaaI family thioesterase [Pseudomonadota bacterium]